ncbi:MAG TPA: serine/threonine-protein kinase [Polyangiaceae bacterium]|nr:serine/threonine-protein kinase [Polyangiaceae bacterium]
MTASTAPVPATLRSGRYAIIGELGAGSQAETLDAVDKLNGRRVAIKRFQVRGAKSWKDVELAEREARVLSTLSHPNLPVYVEHFEEDGALYLVMEKIEGETLASLRKRHATLSHADVARFLADADAALSYLHARVPPIIHRDIKPGNVILRKDGSFAFVDFGSVRDQLKPEGGSTVVGTFGYMAPEQFQGRALPASDVYAIGATALSLVTGREPEDMPHRGLAIDVRAALGSSAEPWLVRALSAMLDPDPDKRAARVPAPGSGRRPAASPAQASAPPPAASEDWRELRNRGREQRRQIRDESRRLRQDIKERVREETRRLRQDVKAQVREETRRARRAAHGHQRERAREWHGHHGFNGPGPLVLMVVVLALTVARVAMWGLFRVFLPTLLSALSLMFGRPLRRAAYRCREVGVDIDHGLSHALAVMRGRVLNQEIETEGEEMADLEPQSPPRTRVSTGPQRVELEPEPGEQLDDSVDAGARREQR